MFLYSFSTILLFQSIINAIICHLGPKSYMKIYLHFSTKSLKKGKLFYGTPGIMHFESSSSFVVRMRILFLFQITHKLSHYIVLTKCRTNFISISRKVGFPELVQSWFLMLSTLTGRSRTLALFRENATSLSFSTGTKGALRRCRWLPYS